MNVVAGGWLPVVSVDHGAGNVVEGGTAHSRKGRCYEDCEVGGS